MIEMGLSYDPLFFSLVFGVEEYWMSCLGNARSVSAWMAVSTFGTSPSITADRPAAVEPTPVRHAGNTRDWSSPGKLQKREGTWKHRAPFKPVLQWLHIPAVNQLVPSRLSGVRMSALPWAFGARALSTATSNC